MGGRWKGKRGFEASDPNSLESQRMVAAGKRKTCGWRKEAKVKPCAEWRRETLGVPGEAPAVRAAARAGCGPRRIPIQAQGRQDRSPWQGTGGPRSRSVQGGPELAPSGRSCSGAWPRSGLPRAIPTQHQARPELPRDQEPQKRGTTTDFILEKKSSYLVINNKGVRKGDGEHMRGSGVV